MSGSAPRHGGGPILPGVELSWIDVVLLVGLAARLTRLVTEDSILDGARSWLLDTAHRRYGDAGLRWTHDLIGCPFCIGWWVALAVVATWLAWGSTLVWQVVALVFTLNYVHGHLNARLDAGD